MSSCYKGVTVNQCFGKIRHILPRGSYKLLCTCDLSNLKSFFSSRFSHSRARKPAWISVSSSGAIRNSRELEILLAFLPLGVWYIRKNLNDCCASFRYGSWVECVLTSSLVSRPFCIGMLSDLDLSFSPDFMKHNFWLPLPESFVYPQRKQIKIYSHKYM